MHAEESAFSSPTHQEILPLPVGELMSADDGYRIPERYSHIDQLAKSHGSTLKSPFMSLSFMALLVIPHLKLSDKGLFNSEILFSLLRFPLRIIFYLGVPSSPRRRDRVAAFMGTVSTHFSPRLSSRLLKDPRQPFRSLTQSTLITIEKVFLETDIFF